jgi:hypothetical protein
VRRPSPPALVVLALVAAALAAGCGDSSQTITTGSLPPTRDGRGGKVGAETATSAHLSAADCEALRRRAEAQTGERLAVYGEPTPPSSRCRLTAARVTIGVYLDAGHSARQRYLNRMVEQDQFGAPDPSRIAHHLPGVGDPAPGDQNAGWVPGLGSLFAVRGNRWLTVAYSVDGLPSARARDRAAELARLGFRLTADPQARAGPE